MQIPSDEMYMRLAIQLAQATLGQTGMNPSVGCVVVKDGRIIGTGAHLKMGSAHAEVNALDMAGSAAEGSTVYITLEPCSYFGRTPPCSHRLVHEKVSRVVVACQDPNPKVAGTGINHLRNHGIDVEVGLLKEEAESLNEMFNYFILRRKPFVTVKTATTLDGRIASRHGDSKWISNPSSREIGHSLRHKHHAIMVGVGTVLADDPSLTTRLAVPGLQPVRIVVDSMLRTPVQSKLVVDRTSPTWIVCSDEADPSRAELLEAAGALIIRCGSGPRVDLDRMLDLLYTKEIGSILLEGGSTLNGAMLERGLIQKLIMFIAPKIIGGGHMAPVWCDFNGFDKMENSIPLDRMSVDMVNGDCCITGYPMNGGVG
jgi:diaminohydroxyphosphoribosylaminopyrimidine deaminase/5-amino-6-(5-phosphoribosylamino)uracil reductase